MNYAMLLWQKCPLCGCDGTGVHFHGEGMQGASTTFACGLGLFIDKTTGGLHALFSIRKKRLRVFIATQEDDLTPAQISAAIVDAIAKALLVREPTTKAKKEEPIPRSEPVGPKRAHKITRRPRGKRKKRRTAVVA